jgi:hypothetical protein
MGATEDISVPSIAGSITIGSSPAGLVHARLAHRLESPFRVLVV